MEKRVVVIKTVGVPEMGAPIADALTRVIPLADGEELAAVKAENEHLKARDGVRQSGDDKRWEETQAKLAAAYGVRRHGRLYRRLLVSWAMLWVEIFDWFHFFQTWNREG
jgi:hypothetical protein